MDSLLRCSRYAFGPNRLHYCGPDASRELLAYIEQGDADFGLRKMLSAFETLAPYLGLIAESNGIADIFDDRVVEAYWIGNELLDNVSRARLYRHLTDGLGLKRKMGLRGFSAVESRIGRGAVPHHSFHVMSVWKRTGNNAVAHTLESVDACRVSCGEVVSVSGPRITVRRQPLVESHGLLALGDAQDVTVFRTLDCREDIDELAPGQIITMHWGVPCEVITPKQAAHLKKYTEMNMAMAAVNW